MKFQIESADEDARCGLLTLPHGTVATPVFMPVATLGTIRALSFETLRTIGYKIILANAYHLHMRPSDILIAQLGGLHRFSNWDGNILTDSGGFQIFSLEKHLKVSEAGVEFRSFYNGDVYHITPESILQIQHNLGSDIYMPLDHCTPPHTNYHDAQSAVQRTTDWMVRSIKYAHTHAIPLQNLFAIVQGNFYADLRRESAKQLIELDVGGYALGGLSVGEEAHVFRKILDYAVALLPQKKPRYLMGVGSPDYILEAVARGVDMFDCVYPTRVARNGLALTHHGKLNIKNSRCHADKNPIDTQCRCAVCGRYSRAYIHHLIRCGEIMGAVLLTEHNLFFMYDLLQQIRAAIQAHQFNAFYTAKINIFKQSDA